MAPSTPAPDGVDIVPQSDGWTVRVTEQGQVSETSFKVESAAKSYADGQRFRVSGDTGEGDSHVVG